VTRSKHKKRPSGLETVGHRDGFVSTNFSPFASMCIITNFFDVWGVTYANM